MAMAIYNMVVSYTVVFLLKYMNVTLKKATMMKTGYACPTTMLVHFTVVVCWWHLSGCVCSPHNTEVWRHLYSRAQDWELFWLEINCLFWHLLSYILTSVKSDHAGQPSISICINEPWSTITLLPVYNHELQFERLWTIHLAITTRPLVKHAQIHLPHKL